MPSPQDVIIAIASPPGRSLRGIVRLSGAECLRLLHGAGAAPPARVQYTHRLMLGPHTVPTIALVMPAPHSYTGEDSLELQMPGNPVLLDRAVDALMRHGHLLGIAVRRAEPGEFTARAFLNGRLSLTQAEGVAATIAAQSDAELRAAHWLTSNALGAWAHALADELANALALVEAGIDFTDQDDVIAITPADLVQRLRSLRDRIEHHLQHAVGTESLHAIPWVALLGEPNAGKSALFNALLHHERAVVSNVSGTTRDVLSEPLTVMTPSGPAEVMLLDLAGRDDAADELNALMQSAADQALARAELILRCVPVDQSPPTPLQPHEVIVRTKSDLCAPAATLHEDQSIAVSAHTGAGLDALRTLIATRLADRAVSLSADTLVLRARHESSMRTAHEHLREAIELVEPHEADRQLPHSELVAAAMRIALDDLAALAGDISPDEVLGRVFATFCVGK